MNSKIKLLIIVIILLLFLTFRLPKYDDEERKSKNKFNKNDVIKTLVRQAARWSLAAEQDENPMIAVLHANYGAGYLWALRDIATDDEIKDAANIDILKFRDKITNVQDESNKRIISMCPQLIPKDRYLSVIAKNI